MRLLVHREHSRLELRRKLQARFGDNEDIAPALDTMEQHGYLSDERFAEAYVEGRKRKGYGPLRIKAELGERGIGAGLISRLLEQDAADWYGLMQSAAATKFGKMPDVDGKTQQKAARFLEYRGFPASMIRRFLWDGD
jgi:regulatory protein